MKNKFIRIDQEKLLPQTNEAKWMTAKCERCEKKIIYLIFTAYFG